MLLLCLKWIKQNIRSCAWSLWSSSVYVSSIIHWLRTLPAFFLHQERPYQCCWLHLFAKLFVLEQALLEISCCDLNVTSSVPESCLYLFWIYVTKITVSSCTELVKCFSTVIKKLLVSLFHTHREKFNLIMHFLVEMLPSFLSDACSTWRWFKVETLWMWF